jgi:glycosyltransferase involved in cell wall biosynthesis
MRILQIAPLWERVPPPAYGGTEAVVSVLTEELVRLGHDVVLAASGDSVTTARLASIYPRSLRTAADLANASPYDWAHVGAALALARDVDVVHNHAGELVMAMAPAVDTPMLTTMHCLTTPDTSFVWRRYQGAYNTISRAQGCTLPEGLPGRFVGHVYNAIDVETFPFEPEPGEDLLFLSRIAPEKGPHLAIEVARRAGRRLIIAGKVDRYDQRFYDEVVRDLIDGEQIVFVGEADARQKRELYRRAYCVVMPLTWEEPFGLVMPEAMACGTPVIALRRGSAPELIAHGETGFVVDTIEEMVEAVGRIGSISRAACRAHVERRFAPGIMAEGYLRAYEEILSARRRAPRVTQLAVVARPPGGAVTVA